MFDPLVGQSLGPYRLVERIGAGGMGAVYRAVHQALDQPRAVKILPPGLGSNQDFVTRFVREARMAARLRHANVVQVYDVGSQDGIHYLVMELLEGRSLRDLHREEGRLAFARTIELLRQLASALDAAHALGIVHRDVKPANMIVGSDDHLTLVDFGIARALEASGITGSALIGTPEYMAPELIRGEAPGPGVDQYALGVVAYELLIGQVPFRGESIPATMYCHVHEPPPSPQERRPDLTASVESVLIRQLAKSPQERYPTAVDFVQALALACVPPEAPVYAMAIGHQSEAGTSRAVDSQPTRSPLAASALGKRHRRGRSLFGGAAVLGLVGLVTLLTTNLIPVGQSGSPAGVADHRPSLTPSRPTADVLTVQRQDQPSNGAATPTAESSQPGATEKPIQPGPASSTPLPDRCADAATRFPETRDSASAVRAAYRDSISRKQGRIDQSGSQFWLGEAYAFHHEQIVAGWMAVQLYSERTGRSTYQLTRYVDRDVIVADGPEYRLQATVSREAWAEMLGWPAETCEGAFMRNPANVHWVDLMQASVGDITGAMPAPTPAQSTTGGATAVAGSGRIVVVRGAGGTGARMRSQPGNNGAIITVVPEYMPLVVIGPDRQADGIVWRNVRAPNGIEGWIADSFVTTGQ